METSSVDTGALGALLRLLVSDILVGVPFTSPRVRHTGRSRPYVCVANKD